jgi:hypothetical protein
MLGAVAVARVSVHRSVGLLSAITPSRSLIVSVKGDLRGGNATKVSVFHVLRQTTVWCDVWSFSVCSGAQAVTAFLEKVEEEGVNKYIIEHKVQPACREMRHAYAWVTCACVCSTV